MRHSESDRDREVGREAKSGTQRERDGDEDTQAETEKRDKACSMMEAETGVMQPQAKEHLEPPGPGRGRKNSLLEPSGGVGSF